MPLIKKSNKVIKWPVTISDPEDGGSFGTMEYTAHFKKVGRKTLEELVQIGDGNLLEGTVVGWDDMQDESGNIIPFSKKELKEWCEDTHFVRGTVKALLTMLDDAMAKN